MYDAMVRVCGSTKCVYGCCEFKEKMGINSSKSINIDRNLSVEQISLVRASVGCKTASRPWYSGDSRDGSGVVVGSIVRNRGYECCKMTWLAGVFKKN